ncbi:MAG: ABC transporter permease [Candidatus Gastranaerophilales bacterium]|nr:ABC transporter permease [Candidatus Gastranaerophilales bacterium]
MRLIFRNTRKNIKDYLVYFLTLMIAVSMFYAFNSVQTQPALHELDATKQLLSDQLGILLSALSVIVAVALAFLILYANQFLLKRRKKELGIYTLLGMEKRKIAGIFAGETLCVGFLSLVCGLVFGFLLSQGVSLFSLRLFAVDTAKFQMVFSVSAWKKTVGCFALIFLIVMLFNVRTVAGVKLIDLLTDHRKNDVLAIKNKAISVLLLILSIVSLAVSGALLEQNGILPSRENAWFQIAALCWAVGTILFFYSVSAVLLAVVKENRKVYLRGLNTFLTRQIGSKIRMDFAVLSLVCGLLTVAIGGISVGISSAVTMNEASKAALPFDLNVLAQTDICGETDIVSYLKTRNVDMDEYAEKMEQISLYEADVTYGSLFDGQNVDLWHIDTEIPEMGVTVISITDFNRSLAMQGRQEYSLDGNTFLINCNYEGTRRYIEKFLENHKQIEVGGFTLEAALDKVLSETYWMTSVGNNDRGTLIVPDEVAAVCHKEANVLLVLYGEMTDSDEVLQKMIPIGLEWETEGYRYSEKVMLNGMYYGVGALMVFLCCYIGLVFLLICAALLSLKQLTETADNIYRYGLLQKLGADDAMLYKTLFKQVSVFFLAPLLSAGIFSTFGIGKVSAVMEDFMNMHISTHLGMTVSMLLIVYGGYFLATYFACKRMVQEK